MRNATVTMLGAPPGLEASWWDIVGHAWGKSVHGDVDEAFHAYSLADSYLNGPKLNPSLSVLRHNRGIGSGSVISVPPTDTQVVSMFFDIGHVEPFDGIGSVPHGISDETIARYIRDAQFQLHLGNIPEHRPHVMVLSTGRCGTRSLYELFTGSNLTSYHTYWFMVWSIARWEMVCRLHAGDFRDTRTPDLWAAVRAAEWLGSKPMIGLNHTDTIFAPIFAAIHPKSKFVYLRRNAQDVFRSFIDKDQWSSGGGHFRPLQYEFRGKTLHMDIPGVTPEDGVKHHIEFTEKFARAFGRVMDDRWIEISADRLFGQDREEIAKLLEFTGSDIDLDVAVEHFGVKINEKAHKAA